MRKRLRFGLLALASMVLVFSGCKRNGPDKLDNELEEAMNTASNGSGKYYYLLPESDDFSSIPQDPNNPLNTDKVALGKLLYHETGLALNPKLAQGEYTYSCGSCHHAAAGFQAGIRQGIGEGGKGYGARGEGRVPDPTYPVDSLDVQPIRSPSAMNAAWQEAMLWNGQFGATGVNSGTQASWTAGTPVEDNFLGYEGVETQAIAGLKVHRMIIDSAWMANDPICGPLFTNAFSDRSPSERITRETAGLAIAAYERTLIANEAPFQDYIRGNTEALTDQQKEGATLFFGKAGCATCHNGPALNSMTFHALGMNDLDGPGLYGLTGAGAESAKLGRGGFTGNAADEYKFKVPQLYNLKDSPFYGHGGNFTSVREVVEYFNAGVAQNSNVPAGQLSSFFVPLGLSDDEVTAITDFIENGLYDPNLARYEPSSVPSGLCFPNNDAQSRIDRGCN